MILLLLACAGEPEEPKTCCALDEVAAMCSAGLSDELVISTLETAPEKLELSAQDVIALSEAGCSDAVINTLRGTPVEEVEEAPDAAASTASKKSADEAPWVNLSVTDGAMFMDLTNNTSQTLTNLRITVNGSFSYSMARLAPGDTDSTPKGKFRSGNGGKFAGNITKIYVSCDQGVYAKSF